LIQKIADLSDSLDQLNIQFATENNATPNKKLELDQSSSKMEKVQSNLLKEQNDQYLNISNILKSVYKKSIEEQDFAIAKQMEIVESTIK
jgi:organic radical activating enzyme